MPSLKEFLTNYNKTEKQNTINHIFAENKKQSINNLLKGENKITWQQGLNNELGSLANGYKKVKGTNTIAFIHKQDIPNNKKVTYANMVCDYRPLKSEKYRVRLIVGGDKLTCDFNVASPAASILETKLIINSVILDAHKGARFLTLDIKDFFLCSTLDDLEYMTIKAKYFCMILGKNTI